MKSFSNAESDKHVVAKYTMYYSLLNHPNVSKCEMERHLGTVKPDISMYIGQYPVAIEVQVSNLTPAEIKRRTIEYTKMGISVLWLCAHSPIIHNNAFVAKWERYLHGLYFGWMYYPQSDGNVLATKLKPSQSDSYTEIGYYVDHPKYLKTYRDIVTQSAKRIVEDFKPITRKEFRDYPEARLWTIR